MKKIVILFGFPQTSMMRKIDLEGEDKVMLTVFIEYKLDPAKRQDALILLEGMAEKLSAMGAASYSCLEGIDQPGLFVEMFEVEEVEQYEKIKAWRLVDEAFCACVSGGAAKLNVWAFRAVKR
ncbi:hypothetical protein [Brevibacillus centrosporus]|uniref:hypothetical protein n=1 Tax=Brevibacillus centrosporus TaxID=54910 RepID=UPI002E1CAE16|nr:hypothetical protein [Brevibacillus centrosporus]